MVKVSDTWCPRALCPDAKLRHWLIDRGSLTARLGRRCGHFEVRLLRQSYSSPLRDERRMIALRGGMRCMVREVALECDGRPVVFAHSVLARRGLRGPWRMVAGLGQRPLGAALFADPNIDRHRLHFRRLRSGNALYRCVDVDNLLDRPAAALWARRSLFVSRGARLLVTEVFLPAVLDLAP
ncbi:MAG TPA: chorismate lyase [Burkholderiales bacterium]|nr:chorismate lyase [Burkholderiales bacterium]